MPLNAVLGGQASIMEVYKHDKDVWDDADFENMGWHDATVWAVHSNPDKSELLVDLDYIFSWVNPAGGAAHFTFWVAPVTMVFREIYDLKIALESARGGIEIADFTRSAPLREGEAGPAHRTYRFDCQEGEITLRSLGFQMFVRSAPRHIEAQSLTLEERGGISFALGPNAA